MSDQARERGGASPVRQITGRKVLMILVAGFGIVIAANLAMLFAATGTFPGLVVQNSYVASQEWNRKTAAQRALGWTAASEYSGGILTIRMTGRDGAPVTGLVVTAIVGRPASTREDVSVELAETEGSYAVPLDLAPGRWRIALAATNAAGDPFSAEAEFTVPGSP